MYPRLFRNTFWKTQTCIFAYNVSGLHGMPGDRSFGSEESQQFKKERDLDTPILTLEVARNSKLIAAGDEEVHIRLYITTLTSCFVRATYTSSVSPVYIHTWTGVHTMRILSKLRTKI